MTVKIVKVLVHNCLARSGAEAQRLVKQGAVSVGGCIEPCNKRMPPYTCTCGGWRKVTNPAEMIEEGLVVKVGDGNWRLLKPRSDGKDGFDQVPGICWVQSLDSLDDL